MGEAGRWIIYGVVIGVVSGLGAAGFFYLLEHGTHLILVQLAGYPVSSPAGEKLLALPASLVFRRYLFFLFPALGGLVSGFLVYTFAPEAEGHGTDALVDSFHNRKGFIRARIPLVKALATLATLITGGSAGREGPIAQIGGGFGSILAQVLRLRTRDRRIMLLAGCGGGLGAIFRAPMGGALTALEVLYHEDMETEALIPTVISSITAYTIFTHLFSFRSIFTTPGFVFRNPRELIFYAILGLVCVPLGIFYVKIFYGCRDRFFKKLRLPRTLKPMLGGLGVGLLGLALPQVYGSGWGVIQQAILGQLPILLMAGLVVGKILATSFTISSGGSGGIFGPTLFIGGMIGGTVGFLAQRFFPEIVTQPGAFVIVGMASFFAGVANAPIGSLIMCAEMTGGYGLIAPLLLVSVIALLFTRRYSIYEKQVENKFHSPAHLGDFTINVLEKLRVESVYNRQAQVRSLPAKLPYAQFLQILMEAEDERFALRDEADKIVGLVSLDQIRQALFEDGLGEVVPVQKLAEPAATITPDQSLYEALVLFQQYGISELLVVDSQNPGRILGILRQPDLIEAYSKEIIHRK